MIKATITKLKDIRGRITGYRANIGPVSGANVATPKEAEANCVEEVFKALERLERSTYIGKWRDHFYVVSPDESGWRYWVDTFSRHDYYVGYSGTLEDGIDSALSHLASTLWTHDVEDDNAFVDSLPYSIRQELVDRFKWYREMKRLMDKGYSDDDARAIIGGYKKEDAA